jgi:large subunit ribosomal protein L15
LSQKLAEKEGQAVKIDLGKIGYDKVLGTGKITIPMILQAKSFSKSAVKKIEQAGGKAVVV